MHAMCLFRRLDSNGRHREPFSDAVGEDHWLIFVRNAPWLPTIRQNLLVQKNLETCCWCSMVFQKKRSKCICQYLPPKMAFFLWRCDRFCQGSCASPDCFCSAPHELWGPALDHSNSLGKPWNYQLSGFRTKTICKHGVSSLYSNYRGAYSFKQNQECTCLISENVANLHRDWDSTKIVYGVHGTSTKQSEKLNNRKQVMSHDNESRGPVQFAKIIYIQYILHFFCLNVNGIFKI